MTEQPSMQAQIEAIAERARPVLELYFKAWGEVWQAVQPVLQPYVDLYEADPEGFERMCAEARAEAAAEQSCHCFCAVGHGGAPGICQSEAAPGLTRTYHSQWVGTQHVLMCQPCHDATGAQR